MENDDAQSLDEQATTWFVLLRDDEVTEEDTRAFRAWMAASPQHEAAYRLVERMWGGLDVLAPSIADVRVGARRAGQARRSGRRPASSGRRPIKARRGIAVVAVVLVIGALGWQMAPVGLFADYRTGVGERRTVTLSDGSQVELGTASALDVDFQPGERRVRLLAGEAFFTVRGNLQRPFVVAAQDGEIKDLGTAFDVKIADGVTVAVSQHAVQVSTSDASPVTLTEGQAVHYSNTGISAVTRADLDTIEAWRQDQIIFRDTPLTKVLAELQRYRHDRIALLDSSLGERRVTAVFDARHIDAALDSIAQSLSLRVFRATGLFVVMTQN